MANIYKVVVRIAGDEAAEISDDYVTVFYEDGYILETREDQDEFVRSLKICYSDQYGLLEDGVWIVLLDENNNEVWFD